MPENDERAHDQRETALDEVLHEVEDAETSAPDPARERRHGGEAADAITPNAHAQEESEGD